jgi:hypothetical protein
MRRKNKERCAICGTYLLHKHTIKREVCKNCEPENNIKFAVKRKKSTTILEYKLL